MLKIFLILHVMINYIYRLINIVITIESIAIIKIISF